MRFENPVPERPNIVHRDSLILDLNVNVGHGLSLGRCRCSLQVMARACGNDNTHGHEGDAAYYLTPSSFQKRHEIQTYAKAIGDASYVHQYQKGATLLKKGDEICRKAYAFAGTRKGLPASSPFFNSVGQY